VKEKTTGDHVIFPELSYELVGIAFSVFNELGFGHHEKYYQRAFAVSLKEKNIAFKEQLYHPLKFREKLIGKFYLDFLVDDKIIVELKKGHHFSKQHLDQVHQYLKATGLKLGIIFTFTPDGVAFKRILKLPENE
jgi:GxxExxY protein